MEDNKTSDIPLPCTNGCGFYGNPIFQNMCSKCFGQQQKSNENLQPVTLSATTKPTTDSHSIETISKDSTTATTTTTTTTTTTMTTTLDNNNITEQPSSVNNQDQDQDDNESTATVVTTDAVVLPLEEENEDKPVQKNKGRCFVCRIKIPLTKQLTNKCRCDYVFCDSHRYPDKHECLFDHASMDKGILAKNNPKLNDRPRGGRSFQRLDSF